MGKKVRICTDRLYVMSMFVVIFVITAAIFWVTAYMEMDPFLRWLCLIAWVLGIWEYIYWADCSENEICVTRLGILKRHISAERISSIQFIAWRGRGYLFHQYVVICLDGHRPYNSKNILMRLFFGLWYLSPKVIAVRILEYQCNEYIQKLTELYGNVTLDESFTKWQNRQSKSWLRR